MNRNPHRNVRIAQPRTRFDIHEALKKEIYTQGQPAAQPVIDEPGATPGQQSPAPPPPQQRIGLDDTYIFLDSLARDASGNIAEGQMQWTLSTLNQNQPIQNCTMIQLSDFYFPLIKNAPTAPDYFFYRRVYMQITSLPTTQAVMGADRALHHFAFDIASVNSIAVQLTATEGGRTFYFRQPITDLSRFNVTFMVPSRTGSGFTPIPIHADRVTVEAVPGTNPARFRILDNTVAPLVDLPTLPATFPAVPYVPPTPVAVNFVGFASTQPNLNMSVGSIAGVYVDELVSMNEFTISSLSFATLAVPVICQMIIGKNRIQISARFSSINTASSNYVQPTHVA